MSVLLRGGDCASVGGRKRRRVHAALDAQEGRNPFDYVTRGGGCNDATRRIETGLVALRLIQKNEDEIARRIQRPVGGEDERMICRSVSAVLSDTIRGPCTTAPGGSLRIVKGRSSPPFIRPE